MGQHQQHRQSLAHPSPSLSQSPQSRFSHCPTPSFSTFAPNVDSQIPAPNYLYSAHNAAALPVERGKEKELADSHKQETIKGILLFYNIMCPFS